MNSRLDEISKKLGWGKDEKKEEYKKKFEDKSGIDYCLIEELIPLSLADFTGSPNRQVSTEQIGKDYDKLKRFDMEYQILKGLQYLHDHGITHFDVKDGNFQIMPNGKIVFIDFNISKFTNQKHRYGGTKDWMALEVDQRLDDIDQLADMYAVYKLFTDTNIMYKDKNDRRTPWEEIDFIKENNKELIGFPQYAEKMREEQEIQELNAQTDGVNSLPKETMKEEYKMIMGKICEGWLSLSSNEKAFYAQLEEKERLREEAIISVKFEELKKEADEYEKEANRKIYNLFRKIIAAQAETEVVRAIPDPENTD